MSLSSAPYCTYRNGKKHKGSVLLMIRRNTLIRWCNNHILSNGLIALFLCHFCHHSTGYMYLLPGLLLQRQEFSHWQSEKASPQAAGSVLLGSPQRVEFGLCWSAIIPPFNGHMLIYSHIRLCTTTFTSACAHTHTCPWRDSVLSHKAIDVSLASGLKRFISLALALISILQGTN